MAAVRALFRLFSYLFHSLLALFLIALSLVALASGGQELHLGMLPWAGSQLTYCLLFGSAVGLLSVILALAGRLRFLFFLWALGVAILAVKGYVFSNYHFTPGEVRTTAYLIAASLLALPGAWSQMFRKGRRASRY